MGFVSGGSLTLRLGGVSGGRENKTHQLGLRAAGDKWNTTVKNYLKSPVITAYTVIW